MKLITPIIVALLLASQALSALSAERILVEWDFQKATDTLGWVLAEPIESLKWADGNLVAIPGKGTTKLESPLFEVKATPWQSVEIDMKTDADGTANVYFSNTTAEPYHGFRGGQFTTFDARGDGQYHTYQVHPFWQSLGKITHMRIDPPGKNVSIRAIRVVESSTTTGLPDAYTYTVKLLVAVKRGLTRSEGLLLVTTVVMRLVLGLWAWLGVQVITPLALMLAPAGGLTSR